MKTLPTFLAAAACAAAIAASAASLAPETPLITSPSVTVDAADFEGNMLRIPEKYRAEVRMSYDRVATIVDNIFVTRTLADRARELGLDKDPAIQRRLRQLQDGLLADLYMQKREKEAVAIDLEQRARELFKARESEMKTPELVYVQHILINLNGRTRDTALERAKKVVQDAKGGEDFLALAAKYSDDRRNGGDLGYSSPTSFVEPVRKAIDTMKTKGEISEPIESESGYHIVKFVERKSPRPVKFEETRKKLIEAERERIQKGRIEGTVQEVRNAPDVTIHRANVEALVLPFDAAKMKAAQDAAEDAPAAPAR
jgi:peptidyl-prolyl cis-trans isomerase C